MISKVSILMVLLTVGLSLCERESLSNEPSNKTKNKMASNYKAVLALMIGQKNREPEEYRKMNQLLKPTLLSRREVTINDLISVLIEIFYMNLSYKTKVFLDINNAKVDENMRENYKNLTELIDDEIKSYIIPVNFLQVFSNKDNLRSISKSKNFLDFVESINEINEFKITEIFNYLMKLPKMYGENSGYSMNNFINLIEALIKSGMEKASVKESYQRVLKKFANAVQEDSRNGTYPNKSWSTLVKTILSEVPKDLRNEIFSADWKSNIDVKILDLLKNLSNLYDVNLFILSNLDKSDDQFFYEYSTCPKCQRIALESVLESAEDFLGHFLKKKDIKDGV